jgi:hypothetical protein
MLKNDIDLIKIKLRSFKKYFTMFSCRFGFRIKNK